MCGPWPLGIGGGSIIFAVFEQFIRPENPSPSAPYAHTLESFALAMSGSGRAALGGRVFMQELLGVCRTFGVYTQRWRGRHEIREHPGASRECYAKGRWDGVPYA